MLWVVLKRKWNFAFISTFHLSISYSAVNSVECSLRKPYISMRLTSGYAEFCNVSLLLQVMFRKNAGIPRHIASMFGLPWWSSMEKPQSLSLRVLKLSEPKGCQLRNRWLLESHWKHTRCALLFVHHIAIPLLGFQCEINPKNILGFVEMVGIWQVRGRSNGHAHHMRVFTKHNMNLLWSLSDKGTRVRFCWVPSHCGIDGNERVDQLAKETLDQDIDPLTNVHYTDMKPLVNSFIQKLVQTKWDVAVHGRDLYLVKPTLGPPKKFQHLTRAEEVVITRLRIGHTKSHILSRGPPTGCHHCGQALTIDHMLLECALLQECRDVDSNALFETISETCIVEFLREAGFFYLIWCNLLT